MPRCPKSKTPGEMARKATSLSAAGVAPAPTHSYADADEMIEGACPDAYHLHPERERARQATRGTESQCNLKANHLFLQMVLPSPMARLPPYRHALYAWVPPSPRVRCRKAFVTYLLTYSPMRWPSSPRIEIQSYANCFAILFAKLSMSTGARYCCFYADDVTLLLPCYPCFQYSNRDSPRV